MAGDIRLKIPEIGRSPGIFRGGGGCRDFSIPLRPHTAHIMKINDELIDQVLDQAESGGLDPSPYMESLKFLLLEDDEIEFTEEDQAHLVFLGTVCLECLKRTGQYREISDEEVLFDMEDANWDALEKANGDLDEFLDILQADFEEENLLDFLAFSILPVDEEEEMDEQEEDPMSSDDAQVLGFVRLKAILDTVMMPEV